MTAKRKGKMSEEDVESLVGQLIDDAQAYMDSRVKPDRIQATDYYHGRPFGNEEAGRSQVVITYVRDTIRRIMPSLMRIFTGPERYVEFRPRRADGEELARQQTDYVNYIILEDNPGYQIMHDTFKDALVRRTGIIKWGVEEKEDPEETEYTGLDEMVVLQMMMDPSCTVSGVESDDAMPGKWKATVSREGRPRRVRIWSVPGDEILWNEDARSFADADVVTHTRTLQAFKVVDMGYDEEIVREHMGQTPRAALMATEANAKRVDNGLQSQATRPTAGSGENDMTQLVRFDESYVYMNYDGKRTKLYKVCMVGDSHKLLTKDRYPCVYPVSHRPFALFTPDPEPSTLIGLCPADDAMPTQKIQSQLMRGTLDSLSLALDPVTEIVDGQVNVADLMNTEMGRFVRTAQPGMMREVKHAFVGADVLGVAEYMESVGENSTGESKSSVGMDADAMQSTAKSAISAQLTASQQRKEMVARTFAEGMKVLYSGILRTVVEHQDEARTVRLRGKYVQIDPRGWDANMDVIVNVALGAGLVEERVAGLAQIAAKQEQWLTVGGPNNPLVKLSQIRNTYARIIELLGYKNADEFFEAIDPAQEAAAAEAAAKAPPAPTPEQISAQTEMQKAQLQAQTEELRIQIDAQVRHAAIQQQEREAAEKLAFEREKFGLQIQLDREIEMMKHENAHTREVVKSDTTLRKAQLDSTTKAAIAETSRQASDTQAGATVAAAQIAAGAQHERVEAEVHKAHVDAAVDVHATETAAETARQKGVQDARIAAATTAAKGGAKPQKAKP